MTNSDLEFMKTNIAHVGDTLRISKEDLDTLILIRFIRAEDGEIEFSIVEEPME
jgi:hypothetical protein